MKTATLNPVYARRINIVGAVLLLLALWSVYDGLVAWPRLNRHLAAARPALREQRRTAEEWLTPDPATETSPLDAVYRQASGQPTPRKLTQQMGQLRLPAHTDVTDDELIRQQDAIDELFAQPLYSSANLNGQFIQALVTGLLGLLALGSVHRKRGMVFQADEKGLSGSGFGGEYAWEDLDSVDWRRWSTKDIMVVRFKDGRAVKCDGWHFNGMLALAETILMRRPDLEPAE